MRRATIAAALVLFAGCGEQRVDLFGGCDACAPRDAGADLRARDPRRCGDDARRCEDDEYCVAGACVCRERLVRIGERCVDVDADGDRCGADRIDCPARCEDGACVATCAAGRLECEDGCVDVSRHPLHCGECGRPCGSDQVCVDGRCRAFVPVEACDACASACCGYPGRPLDLVCVAADAC
ncbi:MAG: hypothetical protein KF729_24525 [Sandaracinaceae bacterium]|nr:hypothetical protein [Sandaracinaceae bacterium]